MNTQPIPNETDSDRPNSLKITGDAKPMVPVFSCTVYVSKNDEGNVRGRVANLAGIDASGNSERDVLVKVSKEFKSRVLKMFEAGEEFPWIDPPMPKNESEQIRTIPMHL